MLVTPLAKYSYFLRWCCTDLLNAPHLTGRLDMTNELDGALLLH